MPATQQITGDVQSTGNPTYRLDVKGFAQSISGTTEQLRGYGTVKWTPARILSVGGILTLYGKAQSTAEPFPTGIVDKSVTVSLEYTSANKQSVTMLVTAADVKWNEKTQGTWDITLTGVITAIPTITWTGSPAAADSPVPGNVELFTDGGKIVDPDALQSGETRSWYVWGIGTAHEDELTTLATYVAASVAHISGLKLRSKSVIRKATDAVIVSVSYAPTTTGEDVVNANTFLTTDASGLETVGQSAAWGATPTAHDGLVIRKETVIEYNDGKILHKTEEGLESVQAQREREQTQSTIDPQNLVAGARVSIIAAEQPETPAAPDGTVYHSVDKQEQEDGRFLWTFKYAPRNSKQEIEFDSVVSVDRSTLDSKAELIVVQTTDAVDPAYTSPETPPFTGAVYTDYRRKQIQANPAKYQYTYLYAYETNAQRLVRLAESEHLGDWSARATTAALDGTPAVHDSLVEVAQETERQPNGHVLSKKLHALETDPNKWKRTNSEVVTDSSGWESRANYATIGSKETSLGGLVELNVTTTGLIDGTTGFVVSAGVETLKTKWGRERSKQETDASGITDGGTKARVTSSLWLLKGVHNGSTTYYANDVVLYNDETWLALAQTDAEGAPANPTEGAYWTKLAALPYVSVDAYPMPDNTVGNVLHYGHATTEQQIEARGTRRITDAGGVNPQESFTEVTDSEIPGWTPAWTVTGVTLYETVTEPIPDNPAKWQHTYRAQARTSAEEIADDGTVTTVGVSGLESEGTVTLVNDSATPPATPAVPTGLPVGQKFLKRISRRKGNAWVHRYFFGWETEGERLVREATKDSIDPDGERSQATTAAIDGAAPAHATLTKKRADLSHDLPDGTTLNTTEWGAFTTYESLGRGLARKDIDADGIKSTATTATINGITYGTTGSLAAVSTETRITDAGVSYTLQHYGTATSEQEIVRRIAGSYVDAGGLESTATVAEIGGTSLGSDGGLTLVGTKTEYAQDGSAITVQTYGPATSAEKIVRAIARGSVDPDGIDSEAVVATIGAVTEGDGTGLTLADTETRYTENGTEITVQRYNLVGGGAEKRKMQAAEVHISAKTYEKADIPSVITCAFADLRTTAATVFTANQGNTEFEGVTLRYIGGGKALQILHWAKDDKLITTNFRTDWAQLRSTWISGTLWKVKVGQVISECTGVSRAYITPIGKARTVGQVRYRRRLLGDTMDDVTQGSIIGYTNSGTIFDAFAAYTLRYIGPDIQGSFYIAGSRLWVVDYVFEYDSERHPDDSSVITGWVTTDGTITADALNSPGDFGWTINAPPSTSFGVFTA